MHPSRRAFLLRLRGLAAILPLWAGSTADSPAAALASTLDAVTRTMLARLCRRLVPLEGIPDQSIQAVVDVLNAQAAREPDTRKLLAEGCARAHAAGAGQGAPADCELDAYLASVATTPFFATLRGTTVPVLVNDHAVWALAGYEGESLSRGGYLYGGFADLDWLPAPPADVMGTVE